MVSERAVPARVVEIETPGLNLSLSRGFLKIGRGKELVGKVPLDDIGCVIIAVPGLSLTTNLIDALAQRNVPLVSVGRCFRPSSILLPLLGSGLLADRMQAQAGASLPVRKRLWAQIVRRKIEAQAAVLDYAGSTMGVRLRRIARTVRSGDPENCEGQSARFYWTALMGTEFRRNRGQLGPNALLNYGYTLLRAATLRAICAAGLHPMLGLHHLTRGDGMRLGDDLMEPFRPAVDLAVLGLVRAGMTEVNADAKHRLVRVLHADYRIASGALSPLSTCLVRLSQTIGEVFQGIRRVPELPESRIPLMGGGDGKDDDRDGS